MLQRLMLCLHAPALLTVYKDRNTCILFGDGAGAVVVAADRNGHGVLSTFAKSDGTQRELLWIPIGGVKYPYNPDFINNGSDKLQMKGPDVYKFAVREMYNASIKVIEDAGLDLSDISLVIPHQANIRIIQGLAKRLHASMEWRLGVDGCLWQWPDMGSNSC